MSKKFEHPLADWPETVVKSDGRIFVTGRYPQPRFDKVAAGLTTLAAIVMAILAAVGSGDPMMMLSVFFFFIIAYYLFLKKALLQTFGGSLNIVVEPEQISVGSFFGQKHYSRKLPIEFRIEQHENALTERGNDTSYREAVEVVMQYGEKRVPLAAMPQKNMELARALVLRMQNVCRVSTFSKASQKPGAKESDFGHAPDLG